MLKKIAKKRKIKKEYWQVTLLFLPGVIFFSLFTLYPIVKLFIMSFYEYKIGALKESTFVGLHNYIQVISDEISQAAVVNTLIYALITVPGQIVLGLLIAVFINKLSKAKVFFRVLYYFPVITSWVIVSVLFRYIFQNEGYLNYLIFSMLEVEPVHWLETRMSSLAVLSIIGIWKGIGWSMTVFIAALTAVPLELYEVAEVDGSNSIKNFFYITLPSIRNTILFTFVMLTIGAFNTFTPVKLMTDGKPLHQTEFVLTWMYKNAFEFRNMGYSAALSFTVGLLISIIAIIQFNYFKKA
ncbi:sugar ABC transporter permease [Clostridiales bacterium COT073_COT-073]|nr:sugar ABC transporter permease [Clostridiales bacterium COT073_COT-073]